MILQPTRSECIIFIFPWWHNGMVQMAVRVPGQRQKHGGNKKGLFD